MPKPLTAQPHPPNPPAPGTFAVVVEGGVPPYEVAVDPSPPNPPGITVIPAGPHQWEVQIPPGVPPGTPISGAATDSGAGSATWNATTA